ncbi:hypothetical protein B0T10DRAFT_562726 [Thelonectria olida]|uniref:ribonuclease T1 n=1 Tax=Thelonectria olida TaxID=1576542 RepID=A0A9P8W2I8_9HYPO|nr:hypothetical protein B0T10DRAFT_562726 [Thelonectria olida]
MKFFTAATILLLSSIANAVPTELEIRADPPNSPVHLKNGPAQSKSFKCGKKTYKGRDIYMAAQYGVNLASIGEVRGKGKYPHSIEHNDSKGHHLSFPADCPADKYRKEYPLKVGGVFNGGKNSKPSQERVVYYEEPGEIGTDGHPLVYYCGIMTHEGAPTGGFKLCK